MSDLVLGEVAGRARLVLELGVEELGHEVVRRVLGPPVDVVGEELEAGKGEVTGRDLAVVVEAQALVDPVADRLLVLFRDAEQHADGAHRHHRAEVGDEVEPAGVHERVEGAGAELAHLRLDRVHGLRREHRDSRPRCRSWIGGSSIRISPGGMSIPAMMISSVDPLPERYVSQSTRAFSTSS